MQQPYEKLLPVLEGLDEVLGKLIPTGPMDMEGFEFGDFRVYKPGSFRAFENLVLARKTLTSIYVLARDTLDSDRDHTEAIAVLTRRLIDLTAQTIWLTDYEPTSGFTGAEPGHPNELLNGGDPDVWPSDTDRNGFACGVSAASDWVDAQTLRGLLYDLNEQIGTATKEEGATEGGERKEKLASAIAMLRDQDRMIRLRLDALGARPKLRSDTTSILTKKAPDLVFFWRVESDVTHGGTAGRVLQRATGEVPAIGITPERWRQAQLVTLALDCVVRTSIRALRVLGIDTSTLEGYVKSTREILEEVQQEHPPRGAK